MPRSHPPLLSSLLCAGIVVLILTGCADGPPPPIDPSPAAEPFKLVILISIDGFRPDYLDRGVTPTLNALAASGLRAEAMRPSFPSTTFANHYTLVTGLYPDEHGIVGNTIEDARIPGGRFRIDDHAAVSDRRWWDAAEPIWVTAETHGVRAATMFWPGSEAPIHGVHASEWQRYDESVSAETRVDTVLHWLDQPVATRPRFVTLYFDEVDTAGHHDGPASPAVTRAAAHVDSALARLQAGLAARRLAPDLVIVSDHGMAAISADRVIRIDRIAPAGSYHWVSGGASAGLDPTADHGPELAAALLAAHEHMRCWQKADVPERLHFGHNPRVPAFLCLAEPGWTIANGPPGRGRQNLGTHGYDNAAPPMRATFIANGPDFRAGIVIPPFDNVDVYPLVMRLLGLAPLPNDGTLEPFAAALR
jgi:predicted AlkP superfamily pyrophosphatase or phosphodiesterase